VIFANLTGQRRLRQFLRRLIDKKTREDNSCKPGLGMLFGFSTPCKRAKFGRHGEIPVPILVLSNAHVVWRLVQRCFVSDVRGNYPRYSLVEQFGTRFAFPKNAKRRGEAVESAVRFAQIMANKEPYLFQNGNSESKSIQAHASANFNNATPTQGESIPLICLPFAGVGPSFFNEWGSLTSGRLEVIAVELPGREKRFVEEPYRDVATAVTGILPEVLERVGKRDRVIIFGHSLGAVLAYELSHQLAKTTHIQVAHLVVSGSPAPCLDDQAFLAQVREFAGYDHPALNDPDLRDMLLPVLRADVEMHENYCPSWNNPLPVSITSVRGTDDELVSREEAAQWHSATTMPLQVVELPGSHMYLITSAGKLLHIIEELIGQTISASCN